MNRNLQSERTGRQGRSRRAGLSVLEFSGCAIAVVGGIWLGAVYFGIDLRRVANEALTDAELLDNVPEDWRPVTAEETQVTREQTVTALREELSGLRSEITSLRSGQPSAGGDAGSTSSDDAATNNQTVNQTTQTKESAEKSLAYWARLNEIAAGEVEMQTEAATAFNDANAAKVFAVKSRICRFAAKAVDAVPHQDVDRSLVQFGEQLGVWYERGADLYDKAVQIWETTSAGSKSRAQFNADWSRAELQHRNETVLLNKKASAVRSAASRRFGQEFPEFARPQTETARGAKATGEAG